MGAINCHCLNGKSEAGPILDLAFKTEPSPRRTRVQSKAQAARPAEHMDTELTRAVAVYQARRSLSALRLLPILEAKAALKVSPQAREMYIRLGPRFKGTLYEVHRLADRSVLLGHVKDEKPQGPGCLFHTDGSLIEGVWGKDGLEGSVRVIYTNGEYFEVRSTQGNYQRGEPSGLGMFLSCNGSMYHGQWLRGERTGKGKETWPDKAVYAGDFENGFKHGQGVFRWADGSTYEGGFKRNELDGFGHYVWADMKEYTGTWKSNKMHGKGIYRWPDGRRYEGEFKNDAKEGQGVLTWPDGKSYNGAWAVNRMHGIGVQSSPGAMSRKGEWSRGKRVRWID